MDQMYYDDRAQRGAELLDRERGGWWQEVASEALDIGSRTACILGQLFGEYEYGAETLLGDGADGYNNYEARNHGFTALSTSSQGSDAYAALTAGWRRIIEARRSPRAQMLADAGWLLSRDATVMISPSTGAMRPIFTEEPTTYPPVEIRPMQAQF